MKGAGNKTTATDSKGGGGDTEMLRRVGRSPLAVRAMPFVAVRFVSGARDTLARTRDGACVALQPDPLPDFLRSGATPDFQLRDAARRTVSLRQPRGYPVFLNFY